MGDNETLNSLLERLVGVRKAGRERVVELTKQRLEMVKSQLLQGVGEGAQPSLSPLRLPTPPHISPKDMSLSMEEMRILTDSIRQDLQ